MDSYEFSEPVDILAALDRAFWEGLAAVKWSERRDALQKVKGLASAPRLAPGDYGDLLRELKKVIVKDSNVVCVGEAIGCVGALAKSLRTDFAVRAFYLRISRENSVLQNPILSRMQKELLAITQQDH